MARRERRRCLGLVHFRAVDPVCSPQTHLVNDRNGANPIEVTLTAGDHTLVFANREDGTTPDRVRLIQLP